MDRELNLFERATEICYCVPGGASACAPCRERRAERAAEAAHPAYVYDPVTDSARKVIDGTGLVDMAPRFNRSFIKEFLDNADKLREQERRKKLESYRGHKADFVVFDEATTFPEEAMKNLGGAGWKFPKGVVAVRPGADFSTAEMDPGSPGWWGIDLATGPDETVVWNFPVSSLNTFEIKERDWAPEKPMTATQICKSYEVGQQMARDLREMVLANYYAALLGLS